MSQKRSNVYLLVSLHDDITKEELSQLVKAVNILPTVKEVETVQYDGLGHYIAFQHQDTPK